MPGQVESVNGVQEKQRAHSSIEIVGAAAKRVELAAPAEQLFIRSSAADGIKRSVANGGIIGGNNVDETAHCAVSPADAAISLSTSSSTIRESTSLRSRPARASASWAISTP